MPNRAQSHQFFPVRKCDIVVGATSLSPANFGDNKKWKPRHGTAQHIPHAETTHQPPPRHHRDTGKGLAIHPHGGSDPVQRSCRDDPRWLWSVRRQNCTVNSTTPYCSITQRKATVLMSVDKTSTVLGKNTRSSLHQRLSSI